MIEFFAALTVFLLAHILPEPTGLRQGVINRHGRKTYIVGYSLVSSIALVWLIVSALKAPYIPLWSPRPVTFLVPIILMVFASILFTSTILRPNPLSLAFVTKPILPGDGITRLVRHPLLWALFLWAIGHVVANGDLVAVIMFGGLALFSLAGMKLMQVRAAKVLSHEEYTAAIAKSSGPFLKRFNQAINVTMVVEVLAGLILYITMLYLHEPVIGVDPTVFLSP